MTARSRGREAGKPGWGTAAGVLLLSGAVVGVLWLVVNGLRARERSHGFSPVDLVREVCGRAGVAPERVHAEELREGQRRLWEVRIHVPAGFDARRLLLDLQAAVHNQGGRLDPVEVTEKGGYGLGALAGTVVGAPVRVLVVGDEPPPRRSGARPVSVKARPRLAVVLDDAGYSLEEIDALAPLPVAVAVAVLPNAPLSRQVAQKLAEQGREVLLHLPMEPLPHAGAGPGEGAITTGLGAEEVHRLVAAAAAAVPGARGVNNHMGSRATADEATMAAVTAALVGRGWYLLDSRTTPASVAFQAAQRTGLPALQRDVFLDVLPEPAAIRRALAEAVGLARSRGSAVAIGHVHPATVAVLSQEREGLLRQVELVPPSQLAR